WPAGGRHRARLWPGSRAVGRGRHATIQAAHGIRRAAAGGQGVRVPGELAASVGPCSHLGCVVHGKEAEKTWDCPCYGTRFDRTGKVINGSAVSDRPAAEG